MTNYEKWMSYTSGLSSPDSFLSWAWRFVISAALQRRVGFGGNGDLTFGHGVLFPNIYVILVGKAGVGKGVAIAPAAELLRYHKKKDFTTATPQSTEQELLVIEKVNQANLEDAEATMTKLKRGGEKIDAPLFPSAPDAVTYEALVEDMSNSLRRINHTVINGEGHPKMAIYTHCSMFFTLPELGSLFRKRTDDLINFLLGMYDSPLDYEKKTKTKGDDRIRRGCLSILAGTTPEFMETVFNQQLIDQGYSSRNFFIYAARNRKHVIVPDPLTEEQKNYRLDLLRHIKELAKLFGEVKIEPATLKFLKEWWNYVEENRSERSNISPKLEPYYARKNIHTIKLAMIEHFSESTEMIIPLPAFERAIAILEKEEKNMHMALTFECDNPLSKLTDEVVAYLKTKKQANMVDLMVEFFKQCPQGKHSMEEVLQHLIGVGIVKEEVVSDLIGTKTKLMYKIV